MDRVFTRTGFGTVVTGRSAVGGSPWATRCRSPGGRSAVVRGLQIHGRPVDVAEPGRRTAVALRGIGLDEIDRGQALTLPIC